MFCRYKAEILENEHKLVVLLEIRRLVNYKVGECGLAGTNNQGHKR